jgi:hypothetical protein
MKIVICTDSKTEWNVHDAEEQAFFMAKVFTLQEAATMLQCFVDNMPVYFITPLMI